MGNQLRLILKSIEKVEQSTMGMGEQINKKRTSFSQFKPLSLDLELAAICDLYVLTVIDRHM